MCAAITFNFAFSLEKFKVGPSTTFAGLYLCTSPSGKTMIQPDKKRITNLLKLPVPTCKAEVLSLMGVVSTFRKWVPDLALKDGPLRNLSKKNVHFMWNEDLDKCLDEIRQAIKDSLPLQPFDPS